MHTENMNTPWAPLFVDFAHVETRIIDAPIATVRVAPCRNAISLPPPENAARNRVRRPPIAKTKKVAMIAAIAGMRRRLTVHNSRMSKGNTGRTLMQYSSHVAFGKSGSVKGLGMNPTAIMPAPRRAEYGLYFGLLVLATGVSRLPTFSTLSARTLAALQEICKQGSGYS